MKKRSLRIVNFVICLTFIPFIFSCSQPPGSAVDVGPMLAVTPSPARPTAASLKESTLALASTVAPLPTQPLLGSLETITSQSAARLELLAQLSEGAFTQEIAISPDSQTLAVGTTTGILFFNAVTGEEQDFWSLPAPVEGLAFSPDGDTLAAAYRYPSDEIFSGGTMLDGLAVPKSSLVVWRTADGELVFAKDLAGSGCGEYAVNHLVYSPNGEFIAFDDSNSLRNFGRSQNICLLSTADGSLQRGIDLADDVQAEISAFAFAPDSQRIAVTTMMGQVLLISPGDSQVERIVETNSDFLTALAFSPDGEWFVTAGSGDMPGKIWAVRDGSLLHSLGDPTEDIFSLAVSPDSSLVAMGSSNGTISLWNTEDGNLQQQLPAMMAEKLGAEPLPASIKSCLFSTDGDTLFAVGDTSAAGYPVQIQALYIADGQPLYVLRDRRDGVRGSFSPDGQLFASGGPVDGRLQVWRVPEGDLAFELAGHEGVVNQVVFSPDGTLMVSASDDGTLRLWEAQTPALLQTLSGHNAPVLRVAFSPDGSRLASGSADSSLRVWQASDGSQIALRELESAGQIDALWFVESHNEILYSSWCYSETCWQNDGLKTGLWDVQADQSSTVLDEGAGGLTLDADRFHLAYFSGGLHTGTLVEGIFLPVQDYYSPKGNGALVGATLSPDGSLIVSGNGFGIHLWDWASGELLTVIGQEQTTWQLYGDFSFSPDGKLLALSAEDGTITLWGIQP